MRPLLRNGGNALHSGSPVFALPAIATAGRTNQSAFTVFQGDGYAVNLGLNPQVIAVADPVLYLGIGMHLGQPGLGHAMRLFTGAGLIPGGRCCVCSTDLPLLQAQQRLIIYLVRYQRMTLLMVGLIPLLYLSSKLCGLAGLLAGKLRAIGAGQTHAQTEPHTYRQAPHGSLRAD